MALGAAILGACLSALLWFGLGSGGAIVAMIAWMLIGLTLTLDVPIRELFKWAGTVGEPYSSSVGTPGKIF